MQSSRIIFRTLAFILLSYSLMACTPYDTLSTPYGYNPEEAPSLTESLFGSDQAVISQEAVEKILSSKIELPDSTKLAILRFPETSDSRSRIYGYGYWRSEDYLSLQQSYLDSLETYIGKSERIDQTVVLPSLLTPNVPSIPILREAAVRLQAPLLLVFRVNSDTFQKYKAFKANEYKAFSTVEMVLIDVKTGVIPFTSITTETFLTNKISEDANEQEAMKRAVSVATTKSLVAAADELYVFLKTESY